MSHESQCSFPWSATSPAYLYRDKLKQYTHFIKNIVDTIFRNQNLLHLLLKHNILTQEDITFYENSHFTNSYRKKQAKVTVNKQKIIVLFK